MRGSCACGAATFEIADDAKPMWVAYCHCHSCRRSHAAPMTMEAGFPEAAVTMLSEQPFFRATEKGPRRYFCATCGTRTVVHIEGGLRFFSVPLSNLPDGETRFPPTLHVNYGEHVTAVRDGLPKFRVFPPMKPGEVPDMVPE